MLQPTETTLYPKPVEGPQFVEVKRAVTYARTSGDDSERDSLSSQTELCTEYALSQGYHIVDNLEEDVKGISGANFEAPKLRQALQMAKQGLFDVLIVRNVKRFSRDVEKALTYSRQFREAGITIEYVWDSELNGKKFDSTSSLITLIKYWEAESEKQSIVKRMKEGKRNQSKAGQVFVYKNPPYGYRSVKVNGKLTLEIDPQEAKYAKLMFDWYVSGFSLGEIVRELGELGVPTPTEASHRKSPMKGRKKRGKTVWERTTVKRILNNPAYIGQWYYNKSTANPILVEIAPIIDKDTFSAVQERLGQNRGNPRANAKYEYLFRQRVTCDKCHYKATSKTSKNKYKDSTYTVSFYICTNRNKGRYATVACDCPRFLIRKVDDKVWGWIKSIFMDKKELELKFQEYKQQQAEKNHPIFEQIQTLQQEIDDREQELIVLTHNYNELSLDAKRARASIKVDIERIEATLDRLEARRDKLQAELQKAELTRAQIETIFEFSDKVRRGLQKADESFEKRRQLVEVLDVQIILTVENDKRVVYASLALPYEPKRIEIDPSTSSGQVVSSVCHSKTPVRDAPRENRSQKRRASQRG